MPIKTPIDIIADACQAVYSYRMPQVGTAEHIIEALGNAGFEIVEKPDAYRERWENGFRNIVQILHGGSYAFDISDIVEAVRALKAATRPGEPIEIKLPDGSIHGYYRDGEVLKPGTVAMLTPDGERIVQAIAHGDYTTITEREFAALADLQSRIPKTDLDKLVVGFAERPITPEDFTGKLEPGRLDEAHHGHTRGLDVPPTQASIAQAIRDCFEASRLAYEAAGVIGHDAVSEILNSAEPPATDTEEAA